MSEIEEPTEDKRDREGSEEALFKFPADEPLPEPGAETPVEEARPEREQVVPELAPLPEPGAPPPTPPRAPEPLPRPKPRRAPSLFWPLILVAAGVLLLLSNLGYLPWSAWNTVWRLWPLLLVALGIDVLVGRRSTAGAFVSGLLLLILIGGIVALVFFAQDIPALSRLSEEADLRVERIAHSLGTIEEATVEIDWSSQPGSLDALSDSDSLIEGDIAYRGELIFDVVVRGGRADVKLDRRFTGPWFGPLDLLGDKENRWRVRLHPSVLYDLILDTGAGRCEFDLSKLSVNSLYLDVGAGAVEMALPAGRSFEAEIDGGAGALTIDLPEGVGARVELDSGAGAFRPDERFELVSGERDDDAVWETRNWDTADVRIEFVIDQGAGRITID